MLLTLVSVVLVNVAYPSTEPGRPREFNTCRNIPAPLLDRWEKMGRPYQVLNLEIPWWKVEEQKLSQYELQAPNLFHLT